MKGCESRVRNKKQTRKQWEWCVIFRKSNGSQKRTWKSDCNVLVRRREYVGRIVEEGIEMGGFVMVIAYWRELCDVFVKIFKRKAV